MVRYWKSFRIKISFKKSNYLKKKQLFKIFINNRFEKI